MSNKTPILTYACTAPSDTLIWLQPIDDAVQPDPIKTPSAYNTIPVKTFGLCNSGSKVFVKPTEFSDLDSLKTKLGAETACIDPKQLTCSKSTIIFDITE